MHPTTVLGLQAVVATGTAMAVGWLLHLDHINWIFWTAFVVIAGSTGESLRRVVLRIVGTCAGATVGVAVALVLPNQVAIVAAIATVGLFFTIYFAPVSYPLMVFWLNLGFVMVYTQLGADELDLLRERPLATAIGAVVAGVVTPTVLPVHVTDRYQHALSMYLDAVEEATTAWVAAHSDAERYVDSAHAASTRVDAAYQAVERALPAVVFESNPLIRTQSSLAGQTVHVAAVDEAFRRLARSAPADIDDEAAGGQQPLIHAIGTRIQENLTATRAILGGGAAPVNPSLIDLIRSESTPETLAAVSAKVDDDPVATDEGIRRVLPPEADHSVVWALVGLHRSVVQLATTLGASISAATPHVAPEQTSKEP